MDIEKANKQKDTADYIHRMTTDLCQMAHKVELDFLAYLLDMARIESFDKTKSLQEEKDSRLSG